MKKTLLLILASMLLYGAKVVHLSQEYKTSKKCFSCHPHIIKDWQNSQHSKSHYKKDEFYKKAVDFIAKKQHITKEAVLIKCAKCHNPRIEVTKIDEDQVALLAVGLHDKKITKALDSKTISEGINCLVCHNIDKINKHAPINQRGIDRIQWNQNGIMSGPFGDAKSPYHKTQYRDFFDKNSNQLCLVCHAMTHSLENPNLYFSNLAQNYKSDKKCVYCHMGPKTKGYASTLSIKDGKIKKRMIRHHKFIGPHNENFLKESLLLELKIEKNQLIATIKNNLPHYVPAGCGSREIVIDIEYKNDVTTLERKSISLTTYYKRKKGRKSVPHIAITKTKDMKIPPNGKKIIKVPLSKKGFSKIKVTLYYKLVNDEIVKLLKLKDKKWSKKRLITMKEISI